MPLDEPDDSLELGDATLGADPPAGAQPARTAPHDPWLELCALLAVIQVLLAGYRFGVGNQTIQVTFLKHLIQPSLYAGDPLLNTISHYPSFFFKLLALCISVSDIPAVYFALHCLTAFGALAGCFMLSRAIFNDRTAALVAVALLLGGQHRALANSVLYWPGFTHTWAAFPLALFALVLFYRGRLRTACLLAGLLFNLHALTGAYLLAILALWLAVDYVERSRAAGAWDWGGACRRARLPALCLGLFFAAALPALIAALSHSQNFDEAWVRLVRIRSAPNSFPLSWWETGNADMPRFAAVAALALLALGFGMPEAARRKTWTIVAAIGGLFALGFAGSELWPIPVVIRAQLFRASRLLLPLMLIVIAHGAVQGFRASWRWESVQETSLILPRWMCWLERFCGGMVLAVLAVPPLLPLLPAALGLTALTAWITRRLSKSQAAIAGLSLVFCLAAWRHILFPLADWPTPGAFAEFFGGGADLGALMVAAGLVMAVVALAPYARRRAVVWGSRAGVVLTAAALLAWAWPRIALVAQRRDHWVDAQIWARGNTASTARFLTPARHSRSSFRLHSERAIVGEWRDGTQQYFHAAFTHDWWRRMQDLLPGVMYDAAGRRALSLGQDLPDLPDDRLAALCEKYGADHLVLPRAIEHDFVKKYENESWVVYSSERHAPPPPPVGAHSAQVWTQQQEFLKSTVYPNIEKHRKSNVDLRFVDPAGRPLRAVPYTLRQTNSLFKFGSAIERFVLPPNMREIHERSYSGLVEKEVLESFPEIFNASTIGYSGKWIAVEPRQDVRFYDDLDRYLEYCEKHNIEVQFHFVTGYPPLWLNRLSRAQQTAQLLEHTRQLLERYGKRIPVWQVVNEDHSLYESPAVFKMMKEYDPTLQLGISDCSGWGSGFSLFRSQKSSMLHGLDKQLTWLRGQDAPVDFVAPHCHLPRSLWADVRSMYQLYDWYDELDADVYVSEFGLIRNYGIVGPVRRGRWTDELQAEYYELAFTVAFSHPRVKGINLWGMGYRTFMQGTGLLDRNGKPLPSFHRLKKLIHETWRTNLSGETGPGGGSSFRGFHGEYEVTVRPRRGQEAKGTFVVRPDASNRFRLTVDAIKGTLNAQRLAP